RSPVSQAQRPAVDGSPWTVRPRAVPCIRRSPMSTASLPTTTLSTAQRQFEAALPQMDRALRYQLRRWARDRRADSLAEARAAAWAARHGLVRRGRDLLQVGPTEIAFNAYRYVQKGRRLGNPKRGRRRPDGRLRPSCPSQARLPDSEPRRACQAGN